MTNAPQELKMRRELSYPDYLRRFEDLVGHAEVGQVGSFQGKLVKKLSPSHFEAVINQYEILLKRFEMMVSTSQTIEEGVMMRIRATELELLIENSSVLP